MKPTLSLLTLSAASLVLAGCAHKPVPPSVVPAPPTAVAVAPVVVRQEPLPFPLKRAALTTRIIERLRRRIMGRRESLRDVARVADQIGPIVAAAAQQPQAEAVLRAMAEDRNVALETMRKQWVAWQEADILLESGGDPDAISGSAADGAAQWLAGTAKANGLPVDVAASRRLTSKVEALRFQIAWLDYLSRPDAVPSLPGAPAIAREEANARLPALRSELEGLRAKRRQADARFDPQKAIFAQTRYLLRLYKRFPGPDWLFQAYHGGEGGVGRTLHKYLAGAWPGSTAEAVRFGQAGRPLRYEDLYFNTSPKSHADAFAYLYGRSDDHRHYWWKLRASAEALALYRRDPAAFRKEWEALLPGRKTEVVWYPGAALDALPDMPAVKAAVQSGRLVPIAACREFTLRPASADPRDFGGCAVLRPEARGALRLLAAAYRHAGGTAPLTVGDMTLPQTDVDRRRASHPPRPPKPPFWPPDTELPPVAPAGPPLDFNFHTTGLAFDLPAPPKPQERKRLIYALDRLEDRQILWWINEKARPNLEFHVVPNPCYAQALARLGTSARIPSLSDL